MGRCSLMISRQMGNEGLTGALSQPRSSPQSILPVNGRASAAAALGVLLRPAYCSSSLGTIQAMRLYLWRRKQAAASVEARTVGVLTPRPGTASPAVARPDGHQPGHDGVRHQDLRAHAQISGTGVCESMQATLKAGIWRALPVGHLGDAARVVPELEEEAERPQQRRQHREERADDLVRRAEEGQETADGHGHGQRQDQLRARMRICVSWGSTSCVIGTQRVASAAHPLLSRWRGSPAATIGPAERAWPTTRRSSPGARRV